MVILEKPFAKQECEYQRLAHICHNHPPCKGHKKFASTHSGDQVKTFFYICQILSLNLRTNDT